MLILVNTYIQQLLLLMCLKWNPLSPPGGITRQPGSQGATRPSAPASSVSKTLVARHGRIMVVSDLIVNIHDS